MLNRYRIPTLVLSFLLLFLPLSIHARNTGKEPVTYDILLLNEISPWASGNVWVEILNPNDIPVPLDNWTVEFLSGFDYTFPNDSVEVQPGALHVLEISGNNPLNPDSDGCILSSPAGEVDAITWGMEPDSSAVTLNVGNPLNPVYRFIGANGSLHEPDDVLIRMPIEWETDTASLTGSPHWIYRSGDAASKGAQNPPPPPAYFSPEDGAMIASSFMLAVEGFDWTTHTTFQVARDELFTDVVIEETVDGYSLMIDNLDGGTYYWRVRGNRDGPQPWTNYHEFTRTDFDMEVLIEDFIARGQTSRLPDPSAPAKPYLASAKGGGIPTA